MIKRQCKFRIFQFWFVCLFHFFHLLIRLSYLDRYIKTALPGVHNDEWQPLISYRASLQHNEFEVPLNRQPGRQYKPKKHGRDEDGN